MKTIYASALMGLSLLFSGCQPEKPTGQVSSTATFHWFDYQGQDAVFAEPLAQGSYQNPVAAGFFPDPSITRRGDDYYMVLSSFSYTPGLPILHSTDLVNWQLIGHALNRASQVDMSGMQVSRGIFAPTIRYHDGTFYIITTVVDKGGNFILTATDPAGPWSEPIWLPEVEGIDPDMFFDDDGKVYISHNGEAPGEALYEGHRAIWMWQYDPVKKAVLPDSKKLLVNGGVDLSTKPIWIEAPHIYKHNGWYYLVCAEGGTADQHSAVVFRTRSLSEPFVPYGDNPILTQRDLPADRANPITTAGHADLVQLPNGQWWAVFLATRTYDQTFFNTGRETFLLPVSWKDEWPTILPQGQEIPYRHPAPTGLISSIGAMTQTGNFNWRDEFDNQSLKPDWNLLREFDQSWLTLDGQNLLLNAKAVGMDSLSQPAFIGRRQQHTSFETSTSLVVPKGKISAGLVAFQNEQYHYYLGVKTAAGKTTVFLEQAKGAKPSLISSKDLAANTEQLRLRVQGKAGEISFYYADQTGDWQQLGEVQDAKILSTQVAGGFVGTTLGVHARQEKEDKP
ncbi:glycoside hydrolase family 43 protein [Rheinheimera mangrovi]|uniref:glycoside hydrolase family 43 protein n=1 Tax=Rheinheimera mangrovi TaxID=2498451 RepID=UPI000F8D7B0C|nr:glycoside hydrolase family 43 protein [Rheinheimera mangrovi]